jgi:hypothetical protein
MSHRKPRRSVSAACRGPRSPRPWTSAVPWTLGTTSGDSATFSATCSDADAGGTAQSHRSSARGMQDRCLSRFDWGCESAQRDRRRAPCSSKAQAWRRANSPVAGVAGLAAVAFDEAEAGGVGGQPAVGRWRPEVEFVARRCRELPGGATHLASGWAANSRACSALPRKGRHDGQRDAVVAGGGVEAVEGQGHVGADGLTPSPPRQDLRPLSVLAAFDHAHRWTSRSPAVPRCTDTRQANGREP